MAWYRAGSVTVTNGSATVTGVGTDFVSFASSGDAFRGPDGRSYEIARVVSATELALAEPYLSATGGGQQFAIQPTQSYIRDLALNAGTLLTTFGAVRDGIGQGLIGDGSVAAPAIRFAADQDTGWRRFGDNAMSFVTGGVDRLAINAGNIGIGLSNPGHKLHVNEATATRCTAAIGNPAGILLVGTEASGDSFVRSYNGRNLVFGDDNLGGALREFGRFDAIGNLLVGASTSSAYGGAHRVARQSAENTGILSVDGGGSHSAMFFSVNQAGYSGTGAAVLIGRHSSSGRSVNAGGTVNAQGADYAEYMTKAAGCGTIAAGDACGVDSDGNLTRTWADAVSFVVKSTDPAYVGGDSWASHLPPRPEKPGAEPTAPAAPGPAPERDDPALEAWRAAAAAYPAMIGAYTAAHQAWQDAINDYATALRTWEAALEVERVKVDRIAFCGQVPVNVTGDFAVGDYLIAAAAGAGIKAVAVSEADITFDQYRRRLGKVWAVRDGRAWVDVQHG